MHINKDIRLDTTIAGPGNRITYLFTLVTISSGGIEPDKFIRTMKPQLVNNYRTHPDMKVFRSKQVELHYQYRDQNGNIIATFEISPRDF